MLPHPALRDETLPAELAVVALDAEVLVLRLLVLVQVVLLGGAVVALVAHVRLLPRVGVHVLPQLVLGSELAAAVVADVLLLVGELDVLVEHGPEREPQLAVLADKDLLRLAQVIVVKVHTQAVLALEGRLDGAVELLAVEDAAHLGLVELGLPHEESVARLLVDVHRLRLGELLAAAGADAGGVVDVVEGLAVL